MHGAASRGDPGAERALDSQEDPIVRVDAQTTEVVVAVAVAVGVGVAQPLSRGGQGGVRHVALGSPGQCEPGWHRHQPSRPMAERGTPLSVPGQSALRHVARPPPRAIQSAAGRPPHQPGSGATAATRQTVAVLGTRRLLALRSPCGRSHRSAALSSRPRSLRPRSPQCSAPRAAFSSGRLLLSAALSPPRCSSGRALHGRSRLSAAFLKAALASRPLSALGAVRREERGRAIAGEPR